jgi:hypothetical protein
MTIAQPILVTVNNEWDILILNYISFSLG